MKLKLRCLFTVVLLTLPEWPNLSEGAVAIKSTVKPGICPRREDSVGICVEHCTNDSDCTNEEKCCSNGCGHVCMMPYEVKHGRCPFPMGTLMCAENYHDGQCPGKQKCCRTTCGHACSKPR